MNKVFIPVALALFTITASAQTPRFTGSIGAGFTEPVFDMGPGYDRGWNIKGSAGVNFHHSAGLNLNFMYNDLQINSNTLNALKVPGGSTRLWSLTLDPVIHFRRSAESRADFYITGGGGLYRVTSEFTAPGSVAAFVPFQGTVYPANASADQVISSNSVYKGGLDAGAGVAFGSGRFHSKFFAEAKYHHIFMGNNPITIVPVTVGLKF